MEEEDDPFGALVKFCRPTSSQEHKLHGCQFARESEAFPDAFDSLASAFSQTQAPPSQPPPIVMVSPPASDEDGGGVFPMDKNTPRENEEFRTPPEGHLPPSASSHEDPARNPKPISAVDGKMEEGFGVDELGRENRGLSELEEMGGGSGDGGFRWADSLVGGGEGKEGKSKRARVFEGEFEERALKKIRVLVGNLFPKANDLCRGATHGTEEVDEGGEDGELIDLDVKGIDAEVGPGEDKVLIDVDSSEESEVDDDKGSDNGVIKISDDKGNRGMEVEKVKDGGSLGDASDRREEEGSHFNNHEGCAVGESDERLRNHRIAKIQNDRQDVSGLMDREDIDKFKCNGGGDGGEQSWKEVVRRRRELPLSIRGKSNDIGGKGKVGDVDVKNLCWKELLDVSAAFLNKVGDDSEDVVDFLEMAKRRGMTFPQPSWR